MAFTGLWATTGSRSLVAPSQAVTRLSRDGYQPSMSGSVSAGFGDEIAQRVRDAHGDIAARWFDRLRALLPVGTNEILPSDKILDHIPDLIHEIADYLGGDAFDALVANTSSRRPASSAS